MVRTINDMAATLSLRENKARRNLEDMAEVFRQIESTVDELNRLSDHVSESSHDLSAGSEEQSSVFDELASATGLIFDKASANLEIVESAERMRTLAESLLQFLKTIEKGDDTQLPVRRR